MSSSDRVPHPGEEYTVVPVIPTDSIEHDAQYPCCSDPTCPCHEDPETIGRLATYVQEGTLTPWEATNIITGRGL